MGVRLSGKVGLKEKRSLSLDVLELQIFLIEVLLAGESPLLSGSPAILLQLQGSFPNTRKNQRNRTQEPAKHSRKSLRWKLTPTSTGPMFKKITSKKHHQSPTFGKKIETPRKRYTSKSRKSPNHTKTNTQNKSTCQKKKS